jgi:AcrR family transcriptional regulator
LAKIRESSEVVKDRILDVAGKLFAQHGVDGVSVRKIATEAGINHALIFRYFGSKDGLVTAILHRELSTLKNIFLVIPEQTSDAVKNLRGLLLHFLNENQNLVKLIVRSGLDGLSPESYVDQSTERLATILAKWIESQQTDKNNPNAKLVSIVVIGTLISLVSSAPWLITSVGFPPKDFDKRTEDIIDVLIWVISQAIGLPTKVIQPDQNAEITISEN